LRVIPGDRAVDATGQRIVYVASFGKSIDQINADGTGHKVLVAPGNYVRVPVFSPDGKRIAFDRVTGTGYNQEIFVKNLVDGTTKRLTYASGIDTHPTWSPDGTRIAFTSQRSGQYQIWTMTASGGSQTRLTHTSVAEIAPAWTH
jgi:Tol biopolymer transport system component